MKTRLFSFLLLFAAFIPVVFPSDISLFDSGWARELPSPRALGSFGETLSSIDDFYDEKHLISLQNLGVLAAELVVSNQYTTTSHEAGHGDRIRALRGEWIFSGETRSFWTYFVHKTLFATGNATGFFPRVLSNRENIAVAAGGLNAITRIHEEDLKGLFYLSTMLPIAIYFQKSNASDITQLSSFWAVENLHITPRDMKATELFGFALSRSTWDFVQRIFRHENKIPAWMPNFQTYLTDNGVSWKAKSRFQRFSIALETVVKGRFECEGEIEFAAIDSRVFRAAPIVTVGRHGVCAGIETALKVSSKISVVAGTEFYSPLTMKGFRESPALDRTGNETFFAVRMTR